MLYKPKGSDMIVSCTIKRHTKIAVIMNSCHKVPSSPAYPLFKAKEVDRSQAYGNQPARSSARDSMNMKEDSKRPKESLSNPYEMLFLNLSSGITP